MILTLIFHLLFTQQLSSTFDPQLNWQTLETTHFFIHYHSEIKDVAEAVAQRAEPIYNRLTSKLQWTPAGKIHVVLSDLTDVTNGLSTPFPYNLIYLNPTPPEDNTALDYYNDWLTMLFAHEFTHTVHLDMVGGINKLLRSLFGRSIVPNSAEPQWIIEGLAVYEETENTSKGRGRSPWVDMFLRTVSLENKFSPIERALYWNDRYPFGNAAYWYGSGFHQYLAKKYGEEKIYEFAKKNARMIYISFFNFKTASIFGKSFARLWDEWRKEEKQKWDKITNSYPSQFKGASLFLRKKPQIVSRPTPGENCNTLYASTITHNRPSLQKWSLNSQGQWQKEILRKDLTPSTLFYHKDFLIYSKLSSGKPSRLYHDVWALNVKTKKTKQLTKGLRLRDPIVSKEHIIAIRTNALKSQIVKFPLKLSENDTPLEKVEALKVLYEASGWNTLSKPMVSSDQSHLVFSMKVEKGNRDLYILNLTNNQLIQLTHDAYDDYDPQFSKDGEWLFFDSARPLGPTHVLVPNVFTLRLKDKTIFQVTDVWTGAFWPTPCDQKIFFGIYHSEGFEPTIISFSPPELLEAKTEAPTLTPDLSLIDHALPQSAAHSYSELKTLIPRYLIPLYFYTESDSGIILQTGSFDPLQRHSWMAFGYHLFEPNRPGGNLAYVYRGINPWLFYVTGGATIRNFGAILVDQNLKLLSGNYYERNYQGSIGFIREFQVGEKLSLSGSGGLFYDFRTPLFGIPPITLSQKVDLTITNATTNTTTVIKDITTRPEKGHRWGAEASLGWTSGVKQYLDSINPEKGTHLNFSLEYSPKRFGSELETFITLLSGKSYFGFWRDHSLAFYGAGGLQWLEPLYQRTFQLGGVFGESPFFVQNRRTYSLRGLPSPELQGEGILTASLEYRFPLLKKIPGIGTITLWLKNLHGAFFSDGGQAFHWREPINLFEGLRDGKVEKFNVNRFSLSAGAELRTDASISYAPPLTFRIGYGRVLYLKGQRRVNNETTKIDQIYFIAGTSF